MKKRKLFGVEGDYIMKYIKRDIVQYVSEVRQIGLEKAQDYVNDVFDFLFNILAEGNEVHIAEFGNFTFLTIKPKKYYLNTIPNFEVLPERSKIKFSPCLKLKTLVRDNSLGKPFKTGSQAWVED